jgi:hypothetical protein
VSADLYTSAQTDADTLQARLLNEGREHWPLASERAVYRQIAEWRAFRETDREVLELLSRWREGEHRHREYIPDPLPERIADAFADLIFGAEPEFQSPQVTTTSTDPAGKQTETSKPGPDQELLDDLVDDNDLPSELQDAASKAVGEGEVLYRIYVDRDAHEHPIIEFHSRDCVVPLYRGRRMLAVAFVSDLSNLAPDAPVVRVGDDADPEGQYAWREQPVGGSDTDPVYRYVEIQAPGLTRNLLFRGERHKLGDRVDLAQRDETADLPDEWVHGLEITTRQGKNVPLMLAGRVTNGRAGRLGRSQYAGVKWLLYELNKLQSVGSRNVDTTMHKRVVVGSEFVAPAAPTDDDQGTHRGRARAELPDVFMAPPDNMGEPEQYKVLEFSDAWAAALLAWDGGLTDKILTRTRVAPQLVGRHTEDARTGPALRARLLDSILAAGGKAQVWDTALPQILRAMQLVDALAEEQGGCGNQWADPQELPTVVRANVLPEDETEEVTRHVAATAGRIEARRTAIESLRPEWDADRVDAELRLIDEENPLVFGAIPGQPGANGAPTSIRVPRPPINMGVTASGGNGAVEQPPGQVPPGGTQPKPPA